MKGIYPRSTESSLYQPQFTSCNNNTRDTYNFYDESKTNNTITNSIDLEARSLMSSRMSKRYSRSLLERGSSMQSKVNLGSPVKLTRKKSNSSFNENQLNDKVEIYDQLKSNAQLHSRTRTDGFQIEKQNYSDMFAKRVNYKGIILFEPNPYLLPVFRKDKKKHQTKVSDVSLLLFNQYMKKSNQQKEKMAKQLHKQFTREVESQVSELNYMKNSEFKNNNFFNKNLKRKLVKNIAKKTIEQNNSSNTVTPKQSRSFSQDSVAFQFSHTQNSFFAREKECFLTQNENKPKSELQEYTQNIYENINSCGYDPYGTIQPVQRKTQSNMQKKRQLSSEEKREEYEQDKIGSKRETFSSIYKKRIINLSKILNEQKNQCTRPQTANLNHSVDQKKNNRHALQNHTINHPSSSGYKN